MTLTVNIGNSSQAWIERAKSLFIFAVEGGICARWKAVSAGRNSDVTGSPGQFQWEWRVLPLECAVCY